MEEQTENELETLRRVNTELVAKNTTRKQRIVELESTVAELQSKVTTAEASLRQITIDGPVRQICESISTAPELFQEQLSKYFKVELIDGTLTLLTSDGKAVTDKDGKSVPFERDALSKFLMDGDDARAKAFRAITVTNRASGGSGTTQRSAASTPKAPKVQFGLR
jgi:hypothetical protein